MLLEMQECLLGSEKAHAKAGRCDPAGGVMTTAADRHILALLYLAMRRQQRLIAEKVGKR